MENSEEGRDHTAVITQFGKRTYMVSQVAHKSNSTYHNYWEDIHIDHLPSILKKGEACTYST